MAFDEHRHGDIEEELKSLKDVLSVAQVVVSSLDIDEVLQNILYSAMAVMDMPAGSIALYDEPLGQLSLHAHAGLSERFLERYRWPVKDGTVIRRVLDDGEIFRLEDIGSSGCVDDALILQEGIRSLVAVPLKIQNKIVGLICLDDFEPRTFAESRLNILSILASFAAMSIDNACLHQRTYHLAVTDGLTGLYNQRQFRLMLKEEMVRARRYDKPLTLLMFDVDNFKSFNDTYGHFKGDKALVAVAEILRESMRECDMVFRYGGEEFIAILPETGLDFALKAAERARKSIETLSVDYLRGIAGRGVTVSVGVAAYPEDGIDRDSLLHVADALLYKAKREGKNRVYHQEPEN
ncbi:MAG: diguanylate cyclase [Desulfuromonadaceae bacterium GWC2_58_13]|nr:MAG: diguanylate cyclase [Desulfuromonadaceae bacterium GWC2_58_13]